MQENLWISIPRFLQSLISGFLRSRVDASVNEVNALLIAKERGITIGEKISTDSLGYSNLISILK